MNIYQLQANRRSIRKFLDKPIEHGLLKKFVEYARLSSSAKNLQPIRYYIASNNKIVDDIFEYVSWAGYLKGAHSPSFEERPRAYILFLYDEETTQNPRWDIGASSHAIQLMAQYESLGTCWMGAINRKKIIELCKIDSKYSLDSLLAIGYPAECPLIENTVDGNIKYYLDKDNRLHVPKMSVDDVLIK